MKTGVENCKIWLIRRVDWQDKDHYTKNLNSKSTLQV